jgi:hypothetical protein
MQLWEVPMLQLALKSQPLLKICPLLTVGIFSEMIRVTQ